MRAYLDGDTICVFQWDNKRRLVLDGYPEGVVVAYSNNCGERAPVVESYTENGVLYANIPPEIMQDPHCIEADIRLDGNTLHKTHITVVPGNKPDDYVMEPVEILRYETLAKRIPFDSSYDGQLLYVVRGVATPLKLGDGVEIRDGELIVAGGADLTGYATEEWVKDYVGEHSSEAENHRKQYVRKRNLVSGYFWHKTTATALPYKYAYKNYSVLAPLTLPPGAYYLTAVIPVYSYIVIDNSVQKLNEFDPSINQGSNFALTLTETATLYLTYYHASQITATTPYIVEGSDPLADYYEEPFGISDFVEPYIKNGELVANYLGDAFATQGHYTAVEMSGNVKRVMCKARFVDGASFALVATKDGASSVIDITSGSVHLGFSANSCGVGVFDSLDNLRIVQTIEYDGLVEGTTAAFGFSVDESANELTVYLPNGTTEVVTDPAFTTQNGRYAIWEHYCNVAGSGFHAGAFSMLWCEDVNGKILDDNLQRPDGPVGVAPTGQVYRTFTTHNGNNRDFA